jgi:hypothetical protein
MTWPRRRGVFIYPFDPSTPHHTTTPTSKDCTSVTSSDVWCINNRHQPLNHHLGSCPVARALSRLLRWQKRSRPVPPDNKTSNRVIIHIQPSGGAMQG